MLKPVNDGISTTFRSTGEFAGFPGQPSKYVGEDNPHRGWVLIAAFATTCISGNASKQSPTWAPIVEEMLTWTLLEKKQPNNNDGTCCIFALKEKVQQIQQSKGCSMFLFLL